MARTTRQELRKWAERARHYGATVQIWRPDRDYRLDLTVPYPTWTTIGYAGPLHGVVSVLKAFVYGIENGMRIK